VDQSIFDHGDIARKLFDPAHKLKTQLIELDVNGDATREAELLDGVRKAVRDILGELVVVSPEDEVRIIRTLGRMTITERGERPNNA
jgi:hypothetical protein